MIIRTKISSSPGIYQIQSQINGKIYVGSSYNLKQRRKEHWIVFKSNKHGNTYLQNHFNKYGEYDLLFGIIEFCSKEKLIEREQYYIDLLKPEFNICLIASSILGLKWREESKQKIRGEFNSMQKEGARLKSSISHKGQIAVNKGIPASKESKEKNRLAHLGKPGTSHTEITKEKHSLFMKDWYKTEKGKKLIEKQRILNTGRKKSIETIEKQRNSLKLYFEDKKTGI